ncbi:MAG: thioredoxin domain-containing protein [Candidatus Micrarchaeia archaeon]
MRKFIFAVFLILGILITSGCIGNQIQTNSLIQPNQIMGKYVLNSSDGNNNSINSTSANSTSNFKTTQELETIKTNCEVNKVYFIYADWCPHCQKMKPWVTQLEKEGYLFIRIDSQNRDAVNLARECLTGIAQLKYIPEFVCPSNKQSHVGEFASIEEMKSFVSSCNSMK